MAQLDQLAAAGREQGQPVVNCQAPQSVKEFRTKIRIGGDLLELVQQRNNMLAVIVQLLEEFVERKRVKRLRRRRMRTNSLTAASSQCRSRWRSRRCQRRVGVVALSTICRSA